ncbi:MAG: hypothetical protein JWN70_7126 [Planctomycetaceae bacterium]|nr:hypothetical protein [Planctomycetaceae bacterium]
MTSSPTAPPDPDAFRRQATVAFIVFVVVLFLVAIGLAALGLWLGGWWGLAAGVVLGVLLLAAGLTGGGLIWAMTQDGA